MSKNNTGEAIFIIGIIYFASIFDIWLILMVILPLATWDFTKDHSREAVDLMKAQKAYFLNKAVYYSAKKDTLVSSEASDK